MMAGFLITRLAVACVVLIVTATTFAAEEKKKDVDYGADPGKIGDAATIVDKTFGNSDEKQAIIQNANDAKKKEFEANKTVDDKMDLEVQQKYNDALQGKNAAKRGYTQAVEKHTQAIRNQKNAGFNLHQKEVNQYNANQKYVESKQRYENALKHDDPNVHKYEFEMNKNKTALDKANTDVTNAKQKFEQSKVETSNAQKNVETQKTKYDDASKKFENASKKKEFVNKNNTTKGKSPQQKPTKPISQKVAQAVGDTVTTTDLGSKVYDYREALEKNDVNGQREALFGLSESTLSALAASNPETAAVMAAYNTGKTVKQAVDQAADAERSKSEARDSFKGAQAVQIAADLMNASRDPKTGKPTMTVEEALHRADGYVFGYGDKDNTEFVESMYNDGKVKDKNGNPKTMPKEDELHKMTVGEIIKNSGEGVKDAFVGLTENAAKTVIAVKETGADILDAGKSLLTEDGVAVETVKGTVRDIADNTHAVGTGLVNPDYWKDRAEAVNAVLQGAWDGTKENYDALTGKKSSEQTMKDDQRQMEYKLVEMGMSPTDASRIANEYYNGNSSAASKEIKDFKDGLSDSAKMQGDIDRIQREKDDILKQIQELGGKDPAKQQELLKEYNRLTENQNRLTETQQGLKELEEDEKKRAEADKKKSEGESKKTGEDQKKDKDDEKKNVDEGKKDGGEEKKNAEDEKKNTEDEKKNADDGKKNTDDEKKNAEDEKKNAEDEKKNDGENKTGEDENKKSGGGNQGGSGDHRKSDKDPKPAPPTQGDSDNDNDNNQDDDDGNKSNDLRTSEGTSPTDPTGEGSQIPNGPAGPSLSGFLEKWLTDQGQKFLDNNNLNQYTWKEYEQAMKNAIAEQNAQQTVNQGGQTAQQISTDSANTTANAQDENSWGKHLSDAVQQSISAGLNAAGSSFGGKIGDHVADKLVKGIEGDNHDSGGGSGDSGTSGDSGNSGSGDSGDSGTSGDSGNSGDSGSGGSGDSGTSGDSGDLNTDFDDPDDSDLFGPDSGGGHGGGNVSKGGGKKNGGGKNVSKGGGKKNGGGKTTKTGGKTTKTGGKKNDGGKKSNSNKSGSDGPKCSKCGVSFSKIQQAAFSKENICEACRAEGIAEYQRQVTDGNITCDKCGAKVSISVTDVFGYNTLCHACEAKLLREKAGMSSSSSSKGSGTYSSSGGPPKKSDTSAYKCDYCGKGMNSFVSGKGTGRYCSNACYQNAIKKK